MGRSHGVGGGRWFVGIIVLACSALDRYLDEFCEGLSTFLLLFFIEKVELMEYKYSVRAIREES